MKPETPLHQVIVDSIELAPETIKRYLVDLSAFTKYVGKDPRSWTTAAYVGFMSQLTLNGLQASSLKRMVSVLKFTSYRYAKLTGSPDFADGASVVNVLTPEEAKAWLATCRPMSPIDLRDRALFVLGLETGMRRRALRSLHFANIQAEAVGVRLPPSGGHVLAAVSVQDGPLSVVPLTPTAQAALQPWQDWLGYHRKRGVVFRSLTRRVKKGGETWKIGETLSDSGLYKIVAQRARLAGITPPRPDVFQ